MGRTGPKSRRPSFVIVAVALLCPSLPALAQRVTVKRSPVVVEHKRFDPRRPPADMPPLEDNANAVTQYRFGCATSVQSSVINRRRVRNVSSADGAPGAGGRASSGAPGCAATVRVEGINVELDLKVTIWLPVNARRKLEDHEDGHRVIVERIYDQAAEKAGRDAARKWVGKTVAGEAKDCPAAAQDALRKVNEALGQEYMDATSGWAGRVGDRYDALTDHGRRRDVAESDAIEQAFELEPPPRVEEDRG